MWQQLELDGSWQGRLRPWRKGTPWLKVLKTLVCYRLIAPGSAWRLHRQWFDASAMADLLESDFALAAKDTVYGCLDRLLVHKDDLFKFLVRHWGELFAARFDVLLYDLTTTYFETDELRGQDDLRQFGCSRDKRGDCRQVLIALIVTPEGFPLSYEAMSGNTVDNNTLGGFLCIGTSTHRNFKRPRQDPRRERVAACGGLKCRDSAPVSSHCAESARVRPFTRGTFGLRRRVDASSTALSQAGAQGYPGRYSALQPLMTCGPRWAPLRRRTLAPPRAPGPWAAAADPAPGG